MLIIPLFALMYASAVAKAQATVIGVITDAITKRPIAGASVVVEGSMLVTRSDTGGAYRLTGVPRGPHVVRATRLGYAPSRVSVLVAAGTMEVHIELARNALSLRRVMVTADPASRARGELGTASVIESEAIRNQMATSLAGVLELVPGVQLTSPGLDGTQQVAFRVVPVSSGGFAPLQSATAQNPSAQQLAAFGTQVVLDGVPVSNNANLQSLGARAELTLPTSAGGGIDLRRIPAATIERVEAIRGIPSARFGDLTHGVVLVDTRAGVFEPLLIGRADANTSELAFAGGRLIRRGQTASLTANFARTVTAPGLRDDSRYRLTAGVAHRLVLGTASFDAAPGLDADAAARARLDTRVDMFRVFEDNVSQAPNADLASYSHDAGLRLVERGLVRLGGATHFAFTTAFEGVAQHSYTQGPRLRPAMPFTDRLTPGRSVGTYIGGTYLARVHVDGAPKHLYARTEVSHELTAMGAMHEVRSGTELRREWTSGAGYQFDMEFPPQVDFNGVQGYDRPRRYDAVPPLVTSALYVDDWMSRAIGGSATLQIQAGLRVDVLHRGRTWFSGARDRVLEPRLNLEFAPVPWLRLRGGAGRLAKTPSLDALYPAPQYNDVVNVNWYANEPAERLAVLTTFVFDPTNPQLGYSVADRAEAGVEMDLGQSGGQLSAVVYRDRETGGVGIRPEPTYLLREHYQLTDSTAGTGRPPSIIEPAISADTVPIIVDRRANNLTLHGSGAEATLTLPELPRIRTRIAIQGSLERSRLANDGVEFATTFGDFQLDEQRQRAPYWLGATRTGTLALLTTRLIHHEPAIGLVVTGTIQHTLRQTLQDEGAADTLGWAGYVTRAGTLTPVPPERRADAVYSDLRIARSGLLLQAQRGPVDWITSVQVSKSLPGSGRLSFYAFNALDKVGTYGTREVATLLYPPRRFGLEVSMPVPLGARQ
jgi:hypothetical protein